ncbi:YadA C-terminal domain-containing protein [Hafnia alvei]|nr:YadA-like family protein [Hafnia alvei]MDX6843700.1 YadA C-terminal domain-containing protein [Hafnia alvei]
MNRKITFIAAAITFSIAGAANASLTLTDALGGSSAEAIAFRQWVLDNHKINDPLFDYSSASKATFVDSPTTNIGSSNQTAHNLLDSHNYDLQTFWIPQFESDEAEIAKQTVAQPDPNYADKHTGTPQYVVKTDTTKPVYYGETHRPNTSPVANYADKHTGTPQYVVKTDATKPVYYGETHRPNTSPVANYADKHTGTPQYVVKTDATKPVYYGETHRPNTSPVANYADKHTGTPQYVVKTDTTKPVYYGETHRPNTSPVANYADKHTGTPQYVIKTDATKPVYYGETHRPNTSPVANYADKHTGTPQYVVKTDATKPVYYGETHRPNTSATEVVGRNTTAAPYKTTTSTETDNSLDKQLNKRQIFILNSMADTARYDAQQFNVDNRNIAENHRRNAENSAAIRANAQRLDSVEQHQSSQDSRIDENKKQASAGVSAAFAQANIPQVTENQQFAVGAGVGGYDNENAIAVGASFHATSNSVVKLTVSDDSQDNVGYGAGVSVGW